MPRDTYRPSSAVRRGRFKLIRFHADGEAGRDRFELYDLETDLGETRDQSRDRPALVGDLDAAIDRYLADTGALVPFANPAYRARVD